jgi:hypothetical protein
MSRGEFEKRWMAYLDGQLSAGEASAFDESLDPEGRSRVEAELRLEAALADRLNDCPGCPAELWQKTLRMLDCADPTPLSRRFTRRAGLWALAASAVLMTSLGMAYAFGASLPAGRVLGAAVDSGESTVRMARLGITETCVSDFALRAQTPCSREAIEKYLAEHDIRLALVPDSGSQVMVNHRVRPLGSCMGNCPKGEVVEVLFDLDGQPAKLVLARADSSGAKLIRKEVERGTVVRTKVLGDYLAGVVYSGNNPEDCGLLLDLIRVKNEQVALRNFVNQFASTTV